MGTAKFGSLRHDRLSHHCYISKVFEIARCSDSITTTSRTPVASDLRCLDHRSKGLPASVPTGFPSVHKVTPPVTVGAPVRAMCTKAHTELYYRTYSTVGRLHPSRRPTRPHRQRSPWRLNLTTHSIDMPTPQPRSPHPHPPSVERRRGRKPGSVWCFPPFHQTLRDHTKAGEGLDGSMNGPGRSSQYEVVTSYDRVGRVSS